MAKSAGERPAVPAPVYGHRFMVVSGHPAASLAALGTFRKGGSLADAAISASAALAVVVGHATSIGGDCFVLVHDAKAAKTVGLNASGVAPAAATPDRFKGGMKVKGPLACVVPGLVRAWEQLHTRYGRLGWAAVLDEPIALAEAHAVSYILATRIPDGRADLAADPGCAALYLPGGKPVEVGGILRQPELAATLKRIAAQGADEYYHGETARHIAAAFERAGGLMTAKDLAGYQPMWVEPLSTEYRGHRVTVMPPNSVGGLLLMQLDGLSALDSAEYTADPARTLGYQMSAMKAAFEHGAPLVADPAMIPDAGACMLSAQMKARMREAVLKGRPGGTVPGGGGTACIAMADADGNMICIVQSVYNVFGASFRDAASGILFNNRMQDFAHEPGKPGSVGPGRRPFHTLCPILVHKDGRPRFALCSPGGISQTLTAVQVLTHLLDRGGDVSVAVEAARWCNRKGGDFLIDPSFPENTVATLAAMGHSARRGGDAYYYGSAKAVELHPSGTLAGAGDHRREAFALGE